MGKPAQEPPAGPPGPTHVGRVALFALQTQSRSPGERFASLRREWGSSYRRVVEACPSGGYPIPEWQELGPAVRVVSGEFLPASLSNREYTLDAEALALELGTYNAERQCFPVASPAAAKASRWRSTALCNCRGNLAREFKQHYVSGLVRAEATVRARPTRWDRKSPTVWGSTT